jgi:diguanylate cyclase (GGDEF)-like protein
VGELGRGSMGIVYKARDPLIGRFVAVKVADLSRLSSKEIEEYESRFYQEAKAAGSLNNNHIFTIYDMGKSGDMPYIAMEILQGRELGKLISEKGVAVEDVLNISIQVSNALGYAHQHGVVHRDVKPENIMVLDNMLVKIADFGIAQIPNSMVKTRANKIMGSPAYMSPEQIQFQPTDARTDIFSFGVVMYQMLTGKLPFMGENIMALMRQIVDSTPPLPSSLNPKVPDMLDDIVSKCMAKNPSARYQTAYELEDALRACKEMVSGISESRMMFHRNSQFKFIKMLATPGGIPPHKAMLASVIAMLTIFVVDFATDATVQLHLLYIYPLILVCIHCSNLRYVKSVVALAIMLQAMTLLSYGNEIPLHSKITLACIVLASNIGISMVAVMARITFSEVEQLASFDWLTGLYNRKGFEPLVEMEIRRQRRYGSDFSFAYVDIDDFKKLNDTQGHQAGDTVLKLLAKIMREQVRETDTIGRLDGDEFAVMMPKTSESESEKVCNNLCVAITDQMNKAGFSVSASIGYVTFLKAPDSVSDVFDKASKVMYAAQASGKGSVVKGG